MAADTVWYGVRVAVEIRVADDPPGKRTYEDRVIVVRASSEAVARRKAERLTRADEETYRNFKGDIVKWRFRDVVDNWLILDDNISDGTEVYSAFMNYRFYRSLANKSETGLWQAYVRTHPRANPAKITVGRVLEWHARRAPQSVARFRALAPHLLDNPRLRKRLKMDQTPKRRK